MSNNFIDNIMMKKDDISDLKNNKGYVKESDLPDIIARIVTAEFIEAQNAKFSQAQIDQLDSGDIRVSGTIYANEGNIGGARIKDGILEVKNANIAENLDAKHIDVQSIAAVNAFIQALTVVKLESHYIDVDIADTNKECSTSINGTQMDTKYPIYMLVNDPENNYYLVQNTFWFNNEQWVKLLVFKQAEITIDPIDPEKKSILDSNVRTLICTSKYLQTGFIKYSWSHIFIS